MLPRIKIQYMNGQLGTVGESPDGLFAIVCSAVAVTSTFTLEKAYGIQRMEDLLALGVTKENNPRLYKHIEDFYNEAEDGTKVIVYGVPKTAKMTALCEKTSGSIRNLITSQNGALRGIFVARDDNSTSVTTTEGLDSDVYTALAKAQQLAEWATTELYAPLFIVLEGRNYTGTNQKDLSEQSCNRVAILIGDTESGSVNACIGTMAGRLAGLPVQRNIGRTKDGALFPTEMYIGAKKVDESDSVISDLYDKCYIIPRKYVGRSGYFFADDNLACDPTDDYAHLAPRRVIDKAYRIAYDTMLDMMLDELNVNEDGTLQTGIIKSWQQTVENRINREMTANGELSASEDGNGCVCFIDPKQNVLSTSKVVVTLKVRPFAYGRYIDVNLGFLVTQTN